MTTQPTSQRLQEVCKEKGVTVESEYVWFKWSGSDIPLTQTLDWLGYASRTYEIIAPALTFEEAWKLLPESFNYKGEDATLDMWKSDGTEGMIESAFCAKYRIWDRPILASFHHDENPAEAIVQLLIWVIESGYWKEQS